MHLRFSVFIWCVGISPSCPTPTAPHSASVFLRSQHRAGSGGSCSYTAEVILSCPAGLVQLEVRRSFPRALYPHPISISHFHIPTLQPGTIPLPGKGEGTVYCTPCSCCITSSGQNEQILSFIAKALLPSGLALSLQVGSAHPSIKTPTTNPKVFKKPPKHLLGSSIFPTEPL